MFSIFNSPVNSPDTIGGIEYKSFVSFIEMVKGELDGLILSSGWDEKWQWHANIDPSVDSMLIDSFHMYDDMLGEMHSAMEISIILSTNGYYSLLIWVNDNTR